MGSYDLCEKPTGCAPETGCIKDCLDHLGEPEHLHEELPAGLIPTLPIPDPMRPSHRMTSQPHCNDELCSQRIQFITMEGHEIRMMDSPSEANNISITTSDALQHMRFDELNKMTFIASNKHTHFFVNPGHASSGIGQESGNVKYLDPNAYKNSSESTALNTSTYQLIMTEKKHKLWLADTDQAPRIHQYTTKGHEVLLLDKDDRDIDGNSELGKIQITTHDKLMQMVFDIDSGDILLTNYNIEGRSGKTLPNEKGNIRGGNTKTGRPGSIKLYAMGDIDLHAEHNIHMIAGNDVIAKRYTRTDSDYWVPDYNYNLDEGKWKEVYTEGYGYKTQDVRNGWQTSDFGWADEGDVPIDTSPMMPTPIRPTVHHDLTIKKY